jgi:segregation and condensation protein A
MYKVKLDIFEGPLDLLLYLIRKNEMDIYNIPITEITDQYVEYINLMQSLDLDIAGEFLVMAATLLQMKSEAMLPSGVTSDFDEPMMTREELVRQLLEYKKFRDAATALSYSRPRNFRD